ncbi:hypothetical protein TBLA_0D04370 [Henningerozyma blattae CBS 6284]|uniref:DNA polymerase n=1 Tax=Henningerozyma blattae (strain ATCC 34711 / CBS 6284 / DSM 70876 / NBRC 10599 / NRRL Y-10934 / UCD 77-7) TaxID=1071380 RepID=I2H3I1_HENB6|nr:hypothetical protein TBLA_0D04370 [Tetrapisispora blattae CBS 6284]CCH60933.1 hypothetical protein TBLA_0D04370 [Tetrapisispora blattae CBS 6284]
MAIFKGRSFILFPNNEVSSINIFENLIKNNGGKIIEYEHDITNASPDINYGYSHIIGLVNDSYLTLNNNKYEIYENNLLLNEMDLNKRKLWEFVKKNNITLVNISSVSFWLKVKKILINQDNIITITKDPGLHLEEISTSDSCNQSTSECETDIGDIINELVKCNSGSSKNLNSNLNNADNVGEVSSSGTLHGLKNEVIPQYNNEIEEDNKSISASSLARNTNGNELLIKTLDKLSKIHTIRGDEFRSRGYKLAKISVSKYPHKIKSAKEAQEKIPHIGASIAKKIETLLKTGKLPGLEIASKLESRKEYFSSCYGIGPVTAENWDSLQINSLNEALKRFPKIFQHDWSILFGWKYYEDWNKKIPRSECVKHMQIIKEELKLLDDSIECEIQGSFRRNRALCGDIDILFYKKECDDISDLYVVLEMLAIKLYKKKYIKCFLQLSKNINLVFDNEIQTTLQKAGISNNEFRSISLTNRPKLFLGAKLSTTIPEFDTSLYTINPEIDVKLHSEDKYMSSSVQANSVSHALEEYPCRRIDFFICKWSEIGASKLHYTGSGEFNREVRKIAISKGMKLTQHGLYQNDILLESFNEKRIFDLLDIPFIEPPDRQELKF